MPAANLKPPLQVFISYSHKDDQLRERFLVHLSQLKRQGLINPWQDRRITPGADWAGQIDEHLNSADITVFLVSADFLASDYCNDLEMKRAIERSRNGQTRVVPVILGPCDWKASSLAEFQVLPKDGKPVVDWPTAEHGLEDAAQGLRRLIVELCGAEPVQAQIQLTTTRRRNRRLMVGLFTAAMLLLIWRVLKTGGSYLREGTALLNVGEYEAAKSPLQHAKRWNPFSSTAACGLRAVELNAMRLSSEKTPSEKAQFAQGLKEASAQYPGCAYLEVLTGDYDYEVLQDRKAALAGYESAVKHEPGLAEAYFDIGRIQFLQGDPDGAVKSYETAARLSPDTARYAVNLADAYFREEEYDKAIDQYGRTGRFPLAALEIAKIYRLQDHLADAEESERRAQDWLKDQNIREAESQAAWAFDTCPLQQVRLSQMADKDCYAALELDITRYLRTGQAEALKAMSVTLNGCRSQQELTAILRWDLRRLGNQTPALAPRVEQIVRAVLAGGETGVDCPSHDAQSGN